MRQTVEFNFYIYYNFNLYESQYLRTYFDNRQNKREQTYRLFLSACSFCLHMGFTHIHVEAECNIRTPQALKLSLGASLLHSAF